MDFKKDEAFKVLLLLGILVVGALVFSGTASSAAVGNTTHPKYQHNNSGQSPYIGPQTNTTKWKYQTSEYPIESSPAIGNDGSIYFGGEDKNIYALYPNGTLKWKYQTGYLIMSSPVIGSDGTIYIGSMDKHFYAMNPNGTVKWKFFTNESIYSSPAIGKDGTIYFGTMMDNFYALHPNGTLKWKYKTGPVYRACPAIGTDGTIYIGGFDGNLYALNSNGTLKWKYFTNREIERSASVGADGTIYFTNRDHELFALNPDGKLKWNKTFTQDVSRCTPAISNNGTIYVGCEDNILYAFNSYGKEIWEFAAPKAFIASATIGADGTIYIACNDTNLYAINSNGTLKWKYKSRLIVTTAPTIGPDGTIYMGSRDGALNAITDIKVTPSTPGGNYNNSLIVYLRTNIPGTIYYKFVNNTSTDWLIYTFPLVIKNTCNLSYYGVAEDGNSSPITTETYNITYPKPTVNASLKGGVYNTKKIITLKTSSNTETKTYYTLDGTNPQISGTRLLYQSPIKITKTTLLKYSALASTGIWSPNYSQKYIIDTVAPKVIPHHVGKILPDTTLQIKFSKNIYAGINYNKIYLLNRNTGKLVKISKIIKGHTLLIKHSKLNKNTMYTLYIPKVSVKDYAGNLLKTRYVSKYMTIK